MYVARTGVSGARHLLQPKWQRKIVMKMAMEMMKMMLRSIVMMTMAMFFAIYSLHTHTCTLRT